MAGLWQQAIDAQLAAVRKSRRAAEVAAWKQSTDAIMVSSYHAGVGGVCGGECV